MSTIAPLQWAQQQMHQMQMPISLKSPLMMPSSQTSGLGPADLDPYGGLLPHTQQQELIHQQMANRQQQLQGGGGLGSFFGSGVSSAQTQSPNGSPAFHPNQGPRSPTQIQDPASLNGQRITSGSYVYTNGVAAAAAAPTSGQQHYGPANGYHVIDSSQHQYHQQYQSPSEYSTPASSADASTTSSYSPYQSNGAGPPPSSPSLVSQHTSSKSSSGSSSRYTGTFDPAKLKRAQSTPKIVSAAKSFGSSGGKSFMNSIRGGNSS